MSYVANKILTMKDKSQLVRYVLLLWSASTKKHDYVTKQGSLLIYDNGIYYDICAVNTIGVLIDYDLSDGFLFCFKIKKIQIQKILISAIILNPVTTKVSP